MSQRISMNNSCGMNTEPFSLCVSAWCCLQLALAIGACGSCVVGAVKGGEKPKDVTIGEKERRNDEATEASTYKEAEPTENKPEIGFRVISFIRKPNKVLISAKLTNSSKKTVKMMLCNMPDPVESWTFSSEKGGEGEMRNNVCRYEGKNLFDLKEGKTKEVSVVELAPGEEYEWNAIIMKGNKCLKINEYSGMSVRLVIYVHGDTSNKIYELQVTMHSENCHVSKYSDRYNNCLIETETNTQLMERHD